MKAVVLAIALFTTVGCAHRHGSGMPMSPAGPRQPEVDDARRAERAVAAPRLEPQAGKRASRNETTVEARADVTDANSAAPKPVGSSWSVVTTTPPPAATQGQGVASEPVQSGDDPPHDSPTRRRGIRAIDVVLGSVGAAFAALALRKRARDSASAG